MLSLSLPMLICLWLTPAADDREAHATYIRQHYAKFEYQVPMRDGIKLFTSVYIPNDRSHTYPILMVRTPYSAGPYGADKYRSSLGPTRDFATQGYIFVFQDVRGKYMSEGTFENMRSHRPSNPRPKNTNESTDTYDTIEWLLKHLPSHNGRVGQWGISYPGFYTSAGMIDSHPALKAVSPQAPIADWFWDDMHHHGAFVLPLGFNFFASFGVPRPEPTTERSPRFQHGTPDGYQFFLDLGPLSNVNKRYFKGEIPFWNSFVEHPNYDEFWQSRNILPHLKNIKAAVLTVGGWFDTEDLYGPLQTYAYTERNNPGIYNALIMGPWRHGGWGRDQGTHLGEMDFGFATSEDYRKRMILPFFNHFLKDGPNPQLPEATVFETGANRWREFNQWPPKNIIETQLYLQPGYKLSAKKPTSADDAQANDSFISDPHKPVPYTTEFTSGWARKYMTEDQRWIGRRPDVLVYQTKPLTEDLTIAGPLTAELWVSTDQSAADWIVKVIDVLPNDTETQEIDGSEVILGGAQRLIRWEAIRGRFRESYSEPKPFTPNQVTKVNLPLQDVLHTFKKGHRVMIQIQSSFFPFIDRNPQTYVPNIFKAEEKDFVKATHRIYRSTSHPTAIKFGVLPNHQAGLKPE